MEKSKKIRRFIPCSLYCTSKIESWLEEMAAEGYILYNFSRFDYAVFIKDKPQKIRYRLCLNVNGKHENEIRKIMINHGWQSVCDIKNLIVFSSQAPKPFDADTDYELIRLRNKAIKHHSRQSLFNFTAPMLIIGMYVIFKETAVSTVNFGLSALFIPISTVLFLIANQVIETIDIRTYKKHINDNNSYIKNTSKANLVLYVSKYLSFTAIILSFIILLVSPSAKSNSDIWYNDSDRNENPPFATSEDFVSDNAALKTEPKKGTGAMFNKWSNAASKVNYYWREDECYIHPDGTTERIQLNVDYHETFSPLLSKWLIWDYYFEDKSLDLKSDVNKIFGYDIDYGIYYYNWGYFVVIAQKDNKIIKVEFESNKQTEKDSVDVIEVITEKEVIDTICSYL